MENRIEIPQGQFQLQRLPKRQSELLRAWDAADEYLLQHFAENENPPPDANIVIVNDTFGALAVALHDLRPTAISDSFLSQQATRENLQRNGIAGETVTLLDSLSLPEDGIDYLLIKIPKTLALLEYQLQALRPLLKPTCKIIAAAMVKNLPESAWKLMTRLIGPTRPSQAHKKARLIFTELDPAIRLPANPYPQLYRLEQEDLQLSNHANVFSRESLDIGARFMLQHLLPIKPGRDIIDLGCGNGVLGLMLARRLANTRLTFVDESFMAIASARDNFQHAFGEHRQAEFLVGDCLTGFAESSADYIICNPPFHQQHSIGDQIAWQMFRQSRQVLRLGGELRIVGNRHLNYHLALKKLFGNCHTIASNNKFVILSAIKSA